MIFYAAPGQASAPPVAVIVEEHAATSRVFNVFDVAPQPVEMSLQGRPEQADIKSGSCDVLDKFDWSDPVVMREFVKLEQKVLAEKASPGETDRYRAMRRNRNSQVFADRYIRDYAEVERLRTLSQKLAEIQQYLRPIEF